MRTQLFYILCGLLLITGLGCTYYLTRETKTENKFVSFNDGTFKCTTIIINTNANKEGIADALRHGADIIDGTTGTTPGCVNYEFVRNIT